jgi:hypothetical protein
MEGWEEVVRIEIDGQAYTQKNKTDLPSLEARKLIPWSFVHPRDDGKFELICFTKEEDMANWLRERDFVKLYQSFKEAMEIRRTLREIFDIRMLYDKQFMGWFGEVQTLGEECKPHEDGPACHWIYSTNGRPAPGDSSNSKHINHGALIPNLGLLPRPGGSPAHWGGQIRSLEICAGGKGAILYMGTGFQPPAATFLGPCATSILYTDLVVNGIDYKNAMSDQDLGPC